MSIDFVAVLSHNQTWETLYRLPDLLTPSWHEIEEFLPIRGGSLRRPPPPSKWLYYWQWHLPDQSSVYEAITRDGQADLEAVGPERFDCYATKELLVLQGFPLSWYGFLTSDAVGRNLRNVCRHIAWTLGADSAIYLPDSSYKPSAVFDLILEGESEAAVRKWLRENCGEPAKSLTEIVQTSPSGWDADGYFEETFGCNR